MNESHRIPGIYWERLARRLARRLAVHARNASQARQEATKWRNEAERQYRIRCKKGEVGQCPECKANVGDADVRELI